MEYTWCHGINSYPQEPLTMAVGRGIFKNFFFFFLAAPGLNCDMWDLVPSPGIEPQPPA